MQDSHNNRHNWECKMVKKSINKCEIDRYKRNMQQIQYYYRMTEQQQSHAKTHTKAYIFAALSSASIVMIQIILKQLTKEFHPTLVLGVRGTFLFLFKLSYLQFKGIPVHVADPTVFRAIVKRTVASAVTMVMYLSSVKFIPIGVANALFNTTPIMTFFIEAIYYKKSIFSNSLNLLMTVISFVGVLFIIQPSFLFGQAHPDNYVFYFVVLFSAFTGSFSMIFLHDLRNKANQLVVLQHNYFTQGVFSCILYMTFNKNDDHSIEFLRSHSLWQVGVLLILMLLLTLFSFLAQFFLAKSLYLSTPALSMPFSYVSVILGFAIDMVFLDAKYNWVKVIGLIMASFGLFSKFIMLYVGKGDHKIEQPN